MNKKQIMAAFLCIGLFAGTVLGTAAYVRAEGQANADVINATPTIIQQDIVDAGYVVTNTIVPNTITYLNVSINDTDGIADILNTTVTLRHLSTVETNNPAKTYRVCYNESQATGYQVYPTTGTYLQSVTRTTFGTTMLNYSFEVIVNKTAIDSNGVLTLWTYGLEVEDDSSAANVTALKNFLMAPFVELDYWGNAGANDFLWTGTPESNQTVSFNTLVTSNDNYNLNCSYTGAFAAPWGPPEFWIRYEGDPAIAIPDVSLTPGINSTWYAGTGGYRYMHNITHYIALEFPAGIAKDTTYTGVTIWIQAQNN